MTERADHSAAIGGHRPGPGAATAASGPASGRPPGDASGLAALLAQRDAELLAVRAEQEEFFRVASHDLRAPLRHIAAFGGLLQERIDALGGDAEAGEFLAAVRRSGEQLTRMVDGLLELSRIGRAPMQLAPVDIAALAREAQAGLLARQGQRIVDWQLVAEAPAFTGDAVLLRQLLAHLLDNALKFTRRQAAPVIRLECRGQADGAVRVQVSDNGAGFRSEAAGRLFGVFERLHPASEFEGTGIGLAAARRIVERHGGRIAASGAPEAGCVVTIVLPPAVACASAVGTPQSYRDNAI